MSVLSSTSNLTIYSQPKPFVLLTPEFLPARTGTNYQQILEPSEYEIAYNCLRRCNVDSDPVAIDFETRGTDPTLPHNRIRGMGLAGPDFSFYLDHDDDPDEFDYFLFTIFNDFPQIRWVAHNVYFDGQWLYHKLGRHPNWYVCTFALYRHLATEGFPDGQRWGLKDAMIDLLLWPNPNTEELDQWLVNEGYCNKNKKPDHSEMWRAPRDILGKYCLLDVEATYLLYTRILEPAYHRFPGLVEYFPKFMFHITKHIEQKLRGMLTDVSMLKQQIEDMSSRLETARTLFLNDPRIAPHVATHEATCMQQFMEKEPEKYIKKKMGKQPNQYKKKRLISESEYSMLCSKYDIEFDEHGNTLLYEKKPD